jgi:hypothetical protein
MTSRPSTSITLVIVGHQTIAALDTARHSRFAGPAHRGPDDAGPKMSTMLPMSCRANKRVISRAVTRLIHFMVTRGQRKIGTCPLGGL